MGLRPGDDAPDWVADFDSATASVRALARFLRGDDFPALGILPELKPLGAALNALPRRARSRVYAWAGWLEAVPEKKLSGLRADEFARWVAASYPERRYPALAIGSANGALLHLWAALGVPWLPQTFLVPVRRRGVHPDEPGQDLEFGRRAGPKLLERNPDLALHHMHDPVQDRLMIDYMTYFRTKWRSLPDAYAGVFDRVEPGGTVFLVDCRTRWPTTAVSERQLFQFGAVGGVTTDELFDGGSERVREFLARYESHRRSWEPPAPDGERPEAEWGFEPAIAGDVERLAAERGLRVVRVVLERPDDASPLVADLHRWWYERRGRVARRLLVESFVVLEPYWAVRAGAAPFWTTFPVEASADALERYLAATEWEDVRILLFSHGTDSAGLAPVERWRELGRLLAVDAERFPQDFAVYVRYRSAVRDLAVEATPPEPLTPAELEEFARGRGEERIRFEGW